MNDIHALDVKETNGFQIPTLREVVSNTTMPYYIDGPPIPYPPQQLDFSDARHLLFPFMKFTCTGTITKLAFLGWLSGSVEQFNVPRLTPWPYFSLWHQDQHWQQIYVKIAGIDYDQRNINRNILNNQLVEVTLTTNITFSQGDFLGISLLQHSSPIESGINMAILKQSEVHGRTQVCYIYHNFEHDWCTESEIEKLYIAIEIGEM